jgi:magnesium-transporting ATPase (P-type)
MLAFTRKLLFALNALNWLCALVFAVLVAIILVEPNALAPGFASLGVRAPAVLHGFAVMFTVWIFVAVAIHVILTRLVAMVDAVADGQPFVAVNADRLRTIAWALLAIQLLDLVSGLVVTRLGEQTGDYVDWSPSPGGWLAVLLLFVLAGVFRQGAAMQADVEATI